jgi:hypothetical protein
LKTHRSGFPVSGSLGMRNRGTVSNSLISISLTLPGEVAGPRVSGKPRAGRSVQSSGSARQNRGLDSQLALSRYEAAVTIAERRAADLPAGTGGSDIRVAI